MHSLEAVAFIWRIECCQQLWLWVELDKPTSFFLYLALQKVQQLRACGWALLYIGCLWWQGLMALFRSFGSRHNWSLTVLLCPHTILLTKSVDLCTLQMILRLYISNSTLIFMWMGHFLCTWIIERLLGFRTMWSFSAKSSIWLNWSGYISISYFAELICVHFISWNVASLVLDLSRRASPIWLVFLWSQQRTLMSSIFHYIYTVGL